MLETRATPTSQPFYIGQKFSNDDSKGTVGRGMANEVSGKPTVIDDLEGKSHVTNPDFPDFAPGRSVEFPDGFLSLESC